MADEIEGSAASAVASYLNPEPPPAVAAKAAMSVAVGSNPDFEAELRRASVRTGVPLDSARAFPEDVKREAEIEGHEFDQMVKYFPDTVRFLGNPENARISHDDVQNMQQTEATIGPIRGPRPTFMSYTGGLLKSFTTSADMARQGIRMQFADLFSGLPGSAAVLADAKSKYEQSAFERDLSTPEFNSSTAQGVYGGLSSTVRMIPGLAAAAATRSSVPLLATMGAQTEAEAYGKYRVRGGTAGEALTGGLAEGAIEVGTEMLPMKFLVSNMGKAGAGHFITGLLAREIPSEQLATLAQDAVDTAIANPDKTWAQYAAERPAAAYQTLLATVTQAGVMGGLNNGMRIVQGRTAEAQQAAQMGDVLGQFNDLASASRVRERDSATAESFFQSLLSEGRSDVWISPKALAESGFMDQIAEALPGVREQLMQAANTGTDVKLPIAALMANLAGPEIAQSIIPHLSEEPGGFTQTTANEYLQSGAAKELADHVTRTLESKRADAAFTASRDTVSAGILEQLTAAGRFSPQVNEAYASMVGNFYAVQAAKLGITPEEMAAKYPLQVRAERMAGAKTLDQSAKIETRVTTDAIERSEDDQFMLDFATPKDANDTTIRAVIDGKEVGYLDLAVGADGKTANVREVKVDKAHRRKGVATALYNAAREQGFDVAQSEHQTTDGKAFRAAYDRNTVAQSPVDQTQKPAFKEWFGGSKVVDENGKPLVVYHGTRGAFTTFDYSKIGEQGRAEGAGFYFTNNKDVASSYGTPMEVYLSIQKPLAYDAKGFSKPVIERIVKRVAELEAAAEGMEIGDGFLSNFGDTYSDGVANVVKRAAKLIAADETALDQLSGIVGSGVNAAYVNQATREVTGYDGVVATGFSNSGDSSNKIFVAFFPEQIKSATGNDGTFDANDPSILSQGDRGSLSFADDITSAPSVISLFKNADLSTFLHESGHFFLEVLNDIASRPDAPAEVKADMAATLKWFGVSDLAAWDAMTLEEKRAYHEQFARGFEAYLFEGRAPTPELQGLFSRFRSWMVNVYKSLTALNVELTDEVREVFDRMLASNEAIEQAEQEGGFAGLFTSKPAFMSDEDWAAYRDLTIDAAQDAAHTLETRSLRDMQWLSNAKSKLLAQMQKAAKEKHAEVRAEVAAEVMAEPINRARSFLKRGLNPDGTTTTDTHKLSIDSLIEMFGGEGDKYARLDWEPLGYGKYGMLAKDGISPDMAAEMFGLQSGESMVRELLSGEQPEAKIEGLTDQRMLERYGDLIDPESIDRAINEALHSGAHARFVATEMAALNKAAGNRAVLAKAAKAFAEATVARVAVKDLRPDLYSAAARRAAKASEAAFKKGDIQTAAAEKQTQLINTYAAKAALDAREQVEKSVQRFKAIANGKDDVVGKTRDMDMVHATRAILAEFGIGTRGKKATEYLAAVAAHDPAMAAVLRERIDSATENAAPIRELTVEQVQGLRDEVESLWYLARRSRQMEVDGDLMDRQDVQDQLRARLEEIGIPDRVPGEGRAVTAGETKLSQMQTMVASLRRVEAWTSAKDGNNEMGPFRRFIWNTIKDPADAYRTDKAKYLKRYRELLEPIAPSLKRVKIDAPEIGYSFGWDKGNMGKVELLHAILHTGNESNLRKLLLGRNWGTEKADGTVDTSKWDAFVNRMINEGVLTKADFDFAQGVWDLLEDMKPLAQKAHREAFGRYFDEVTANSFVTPFGTYRGGYVPAIADSRVSMDAKLRDLTERENESLMNAMPQTSKGFTKSRVDSNRELLLDLRTLSQHIDKVLLFSHMEGPVREVTRVLKSNTVAYPLDRVDPSAYGGLLTPWLSRTARQQVETPVSASNGLMRFFSVVRQRSGMAAMFANVSNTAQQITGFSIAMLRVKPHHLMSAAAQFMVAPSQTAEAVAAASPYMANRMLNEVGAMTGAIDEILLNPGVYDNVLNWTKQHTYFLQSAVDNVMGPIIWTGAYNQALETAPAGMTDEQLKTYARRLADSAVRETQGSTLPEDISRIETGNAFVRIFTQFAGYFNMQANILGTEFARAAQETGLRKGAGRGLYVLMFGFLAPAWVATAIALAFRGGPDDEDKDGSYLDDWLAQTFGWGTLRNATAMVPAVGQTVNALANTFNNKPYDDRLSTAPAISMIESAVSAPADVYALASGKGSATKTVRDVATLVSMTVGVPANALARPLAFATDVKTGKARPTGPLDVARGVITGTSSPASKGR